MSEQAIKVIKIGKRYSIGERIQYGTLRESIISFTSNALSRFRKKPAENTGPGISLNGGTGNTQNFIWSLKDISFEVKKGEIIGIIGNNGAGKSTLLKLISGITEPTEGRIEIYGRIGSLLEVGTGFHPELTGKENIYLNGAILGMKRREIERKFDEIVDFSGIEQFIDTPVKYYSSGMRVRLGFSVAAHLEPDILLLDEVLAVGDAAFQKKCLGKIDNIASSEGRTVLFISHDLTAVQSLCQRTILLDSGKILSEGPTDEIIRAYIQKTHQSTDIPIDKRSDAFGNRQIKITSLKVENADGGKPITAGSKLNIQIDYESESKISGLQVIIEIKDSNTNTILFRFDSKISDDLPEILPPAGRIACLTDPILISPGECTLDVELRINKVSSYGLDSAAVFHVATEDFYGTGKIPTRKQSINLNKYRFILENKPENYL